MPGIKQDILDLQMAEHAFYLQGASGFGKKKKKKLIHMPVLSLIFFRSKDLKGRTILSLLVHA